MNMRTLYLYEFITPSDGITFKAPSNAVAFVASLMLGRGKAGCSREDGESVPSLLLFASDEAVTETIKEQLSGTLNQWMTSHWREVADALDSFAYADFRARAEFDAALEAITDDKKRAAFLEKHDDIRRTSISQWVKQARKDAALIRKKFTEKEAAAV
jgi:hypothetical protein